MKKIIVLMVFICLSLAIFAQEKESSNVKYSAIIEGGLYGAINHFGIDICAINGIIINNKHVLGLGLGFGNKTEKESDTFYSPVFLNYRYYFYNSKSSPFVNLALGGSIFEKGHGLYSSLTAGFRKNAFNFSSGIFFQANNYTRTIDIEDYNYEQGMYYFTSKDEKIKETPVGFIVKIGVTF